MRQAIKSLTTPHRDAHHPELLLQRYLGPSDGSDGDQKRKANLLKAAIQAANSEELHSLYAAAYARWNDSFAKDGPHQSQELTTPGRLVVGLGVQNVLETGLRLHHTYGVPILPGSALKGLASHFCHERWGQAFAESSATDNKPYQRGGVAHKLLFGTTDDGGVITFHDAWIKPDALKTAFNLDVMAPHHTEWQNGTAPPTDFDSPVPVSFLSITGTFKIWLSWRGPAETPKEQANGWLSRAMSILTEALEEWGIGGKTSSGYGRLVSAASASRPNSNVAISATVAKREPLPMPNTRCEGQLLAEKTKKGGWRALHEATGITGPIHNSVDVPDTAQPGDKLTLIVASANTREIAFRYPTAADEQRAKAKEDKPTIDNRGRGDFNRSRR